MNAETLSVKAISWAPRRCDALLVHPVTFHLDAGRVLGVVGANGAGKSTLLRMLYRYNRPLSGSVCIGGQDIWDMSPRAAACKVAAVLQEQPTDFALRVREVVSLGRTPHRSGFTAVGAQDDHIIDTTLERLHLHQFADRLFYSLSGGERQRVMIARALAQEPKVLILDEPINHLDIRHQLETLQLIQELDLTIVTSLHDLNAAATVCDTLLVLDKGRCLGFDSPKTVLSDDLVSQTFQVRARWENIMPSNAPHLTFNLQS